MKDYVIIIIFITADTMKLRHWYLLYAPTFLDYDCTV